MKKHALVALALIALAGCSQQLGDQDRALLTEARNLAEQARSDAAQAAADARAAREAAEKAAAAAAMSSEKSERIFQHGQDK